MFCDGPGLEVITVHHEQYSYLLGQYLGDGWVGPNGGSWSLRVASDTKYPGIIASVCRAIEAVRCPGSPAFVRPHHSTNCMIIASYWKHWACYFPQHGPGRKHHRKIALEPWQQDIVDRQPEAFLAKHHISVARRESVAKLDEFIGLKY